MGEKVFYYKIATKKCFCFCYYRRKNWKKFRRPQYYRPRGGVGGFQLYTCRMYFTLVERVRHTSLTYDIPLLRATSRYCTGIMLARPNIVWGC